MGRKLARIALSHLVLRRFLIRLRVTLRYCDSLLIRSCQTRRLPTSLQPLLTFFLP